MECSCIYLFAISLWYFVMVSSISKITKLKAFCTELENMQCILKLWMILEKMWILGFPSSQHLIFIYFTNLYSVVPYQYLKVLLDLSLLVFPFHCLSYSIFISIHRLSCKKFSLLQCKIIYLFTLLSFNFFIFYFNIYRVYFAIGLPPTCSHLAMD